ncbi:MAG: thiopurine S-methyltransferase [Candidatus Berkiella sp.]
MHKEFWHNRWQKNEIGFDQAQPNTLLKNYFHHLKLKPDARIFVPLCGKSVDMVWLAEQGYQVIGVELNLQACELFFKHYQIPYQEAKIEDYTIFTAKNIRLFAGDYFQVSKEMIGSIDAIYDRAALIALPAEMRDGYVEKTLSLMQAHTQILLITAGYNQAIMQGPPFSIDDTEVHRLFGAHLNIQSLYNQPAHIPSHLQARGLTEAIEMVYQLSND